MLHIFNIFFVVFVKATKNPTVVREFKVDNTIKVKYLMMATIMQGSPLEQLNLCVLTSSRQNIC